MQILLQNFGAETSIDNFSNADKSKSSEGTALEDSIVEGTEVFSLESEEIKYSKDIRNFSFIENDLPKGETSKRSIEFAALQVRGNAELSTPTNSQGRESDSGSVVSKIASDRIPVEQTMLPAPAITKATTFSDTPDPKPVSTPEKQATKTDPHPVALRELPTKVPLTVSVTTSADKIKTAKDSKELAGKSLPDREVGKQIVTQPEARSAKATEVLPSDLQTRFSQLGSASKATVFQPSPKESARLVTPASQSKEMQNAILPYRMAPEETDAPPTRNETDSKLSVIRAAVPEQPIKKNLNVDALERPIKKNLGVDGLERAAQLKIGTSKLERISTPASLEIQYRPFGSQNKPPEQPTNATTDVQTGRALPDDAVAKVEPEALSALPVPKNEGSRRDSKASSARHTDAAVVGGTQTQLRSQTKSSFERDQPRVLNRAVSSNVISPGLDGLQSADTMQIRESGFHALSEGPEVRKELHPSSKIETFARPVVQQLTQALKTTGDGSIEVRLAPDELGRVRLSLNPGETHITVNISAERPETIDLIRRNIELFSQSLKQEGFTSLSFSFTDQGREQNSSQESNASSEYTDEADNFEVAPHSNPASRTVSDGHLDIRL